MTRYCVGALDPHGTRLRKIIANSLPFKGRDGVGMGVTVTNEPIPILAFPLKGKVAHYTYFDVAKHMLFPDAS